MFITGLWICFLGVRNPQRRGTGHALLAAPSLVLVAAAILVAVDAALWR